MTEPKKHGGIDPAIPMRTVRGIGVATDLPLVAGDTIADSRPTGFHDGRIFGRYTILDVLGSGGMGVVLAANDPQLDRKVAIKVLRTRGLTAARREREAARLLQEARALAQLSHPHVITVYEAGVLDDRVFIAMEYVEGQTLRSWLVARERSTAEILDVYIKAGRGLAGAHQAGIIHRDFKPDNVLVGHDGRVRVIDFGLARPPSGQTVTGDDDGPDGTPVYMAPEQHRRMPVDARADQFALCVALWEALAGARPAAGATGSLANVPDRITRALRRGLSARPDDRYPSLEPLLDELSPPQRRGRRWVVATFLAIAALGGTLAFTFARDRSGPSCALAGQPLDRIWNDARRNELRASFAATKVPYAATAAGVAIAQLDDWAARWRRSAGATCRATIIDRVQPAELHALRRACLDELAERLAPIVDLAAHADHLLVARADALVSALPAPERCDDVSILSALPPLPPAERDRAEVASVRASIAELEAALVAGRANQVAASVASLQARATKLTYSPLRARGQLMGARLQLSQANYDGAIAALHEAARTATAARDLELLAEIWIELVQTLGNDQRTLDLARVFDGYAVALIEQLPDRAALALSLEHARCNRNGGSAEAAELAKHCEKTIELAERATPRRDGIANASRTRLGHFYRLLGDLPKAKATLVTAVDEAVRVQGAEHPDTAIARFSLGIAEITEENFGAGIAQLRQSLAIRRAAFPGQSVQVAESLQGLGDALATSGDHVQAIPLLEEAIAMLDATGHADSAHAMSSHILLGMSLEEVKRDDDAIAHYLRGADIADRSLQHREPQAAMGLRLAADLERKQGRAAAGIPHLERAIRLLERGKSSPADIAKTQHRMSELLLALRPPDTARARAMAQAARANYVTAGPRAAAELTELDAYLRQHGWPPAR